MVVDLRNRGWVPPNHAFAQPCLRPSSASPTSHAQPRWGSPGRERLVLSNQQAQKGQGHVEWVQAPSSSPTRDVVVLIPREEYWTPTTAPERARTDRAMSRRPASASPAPRKATRKRRGRKKKEDELSVRPDSPELLDKLTTLLRLQQAGGHNDDGAAIMHSTIRELRSIDRQERRRVSFELPVPTEEEEDPAVTTSLAVAEATSAALAAADRAERAAAVARGVSPPPATCTVEVRDDHDERFEQMWRHLSAASAVAAVSPAPDPTARLERGSPHATDAALQSVYQRNRDDMHEKGVHLDRRVRDLDRRAKAQVAGATSPKSRARK
jgi:hypothetical protein